MDTEKKHQIEALVIALMAEHGLYHWDFQWDHAKRRMGACHHSKRMISLSETICTNASDESVKDTILHEIAHALAGPREQHGEAWRKIAVAIGCNGKATHNEPLTGYRWVGICPNGHEVKKFRLRNQRFSCPICCPVFNVNYLYTWKEIEP
jgi:predicted SprT family Zn-dependent metalloprotease